MKQVLASQSVTVPEGVTIRSRSRVVTVTGPLGSLTKSFKNFYVDIYFASKSKLQIDMWWGNKSRLAALRTIASNIKNMIIGVTKGYTFKMRMVFAHFPIDVSIIEGGKAVKISNYLGQKQVHLVNLIDGVTIRRSEVKDEIILTGNDLDSVSQSAAKIHHSVRAKDKDIRKFLDGIYVSQRIYGDVVKDV